MVAIIGGESARSPPWSTSTERALDRYGLPRLPVGVHSPGHVADTDEEARAQLWPHMKRMRDRIGAERGWGPMGRAEFDQQAGPDGSLYVGSPETVARKIAATVRALRLDRFDLKYSAGQLPHPLLMDSIGLYGTEVVAAGARAGGRRDHRHHADHGGTGHLSAGPSVPRAVPPFEDGGRGEDVVGDERPLVRHGRRADRP